MTDILIEVADLVAGYQRPVIGPLSFSLCPGEVVGLAGANGSGKSTLLRAITGRARVHSGHIHCRAGARLAYQSQQPLEPGELPLRGSELLHLMQADGAALPERLRGLLPLRVDRLSGGQRQLLLVWAALGHPSDILLLDEPTNNLDPEGVELLVDALTRLPPYRGALVISHEQAFLQQVAHRLVQVDG
ncbi:MAG: ATP-binding cassette domain-containing protein [Aquisalimonadaceae bacterium]